MADPIRVDKGPITAYAMAVAGGYEGTYEQFCEDQAHFAENASAVAAAVQTAEGYKDDAQASKNAAAASATAAAGSATAASGSKDAAAASAAQAEAAVTAFSRTGLSVVNGKLCITYSEE